MGVYFQGTNFEQDNLHMEKMHGNCPSLQHARCIASTESMKLQRAFGQMQVIQRPEQSKGAE
jgi:hypothetical protein